MENKGCETCKYEHCDIQDYPCIKCSHSYIDKYKPKTNAGRIRNMSDEELADWLSYMCDFEKNDSYGELLEWLQSEAE